MRNSLFLLFILLLLFVLLPIPALAESLETIDIGSVASVNSEDFIAKVSTMACALYGVAVKVIAPMTVIILVVGGIAAIFFKVARAIIVWAIVGMVVVFWSPMLVQLITNWVTM
ncbi:hypothetical protein ASZ90_017337 [hydrocarbon metagenome]|uniref:Uncharacterized protein n=1 Tax=hydrocarbon metagenome TaxID=938273 RepID=A0A0W8E9I4_9ZZZZ